MKLTRNCDARDVLREFECNVPTHISPDWCRAFDSAIDEFAEEVPGADDVVSHYERLILEIVMHAIAVGSCSEPTACARVAYEAGKRAYFVDAKAA